jgi:DNA-binding MarR family transcriptional regulator
MTVSPNNVANLSIGDLTPRQARVLHFIVEFRDQHDRFPNLRQIRDALAYSLAAVRYHVDTLDEKGWLACSRESFLARIESALRPVAGFPSFSTSPRARRD